jgi:hypothetical protein
VKLAGLALLGAAVLHGQAFSQTDLEGWLTLWQKKQQLPDWTIQIGTAPRKELGPGVVSDTRFLGPKLASIRVLDPGELENVPGRNPRTFAELRVAHEVVHVLVWPLVTNGEQRGVENAVEDMAEALLFGNVPACATPRDFMEAEIFSLPWNPVDARIREQIIRKLTAAFLDGRPAWTKQHAADCSVAIKSFFARSGWR